jgi:CheY-like chemotaxis protein
MSITDKIDVLDLIINVLNEHEKKMDDLVERLEFITELLEGQPEFKKPVPEYYAHVETIENSASVLLVDDDEFLTETFKILLQDAGFIVETALTGNQAIIKASQKDFDLAILDLMLPDITGNELSKRLKERNKRMNVILLTGHTEALEDIDIETLGSDEVLLKPISPDELLKVTEKLKKRT